MLVGLGYQVSRILNPVVQAIKHIDKHFEKNDEGAWATFWARFVGPYAVLAFESPKVARRAILVDFFRCAFDGSGADNFFEAGSCIDGRLTSAWNWCQQLPGKPYFMLFKLAGFRGFDGEFHG